MITVLRTWGLAIASAAADVVGWVNNFRIRTPRVQPMTVVAMTARHMGGD